jgi:hypothetical protein
MPPSVVTTVEIAMNVEISIDVDITVDVSRVDIAIEITVASDVAVHILIAANACTRYIPISGKATTSSLRAATSSRRTATTGPCPAASPALRCGRQKNRNKQTSDDNCHFHSRVLFLSWLVGQT